MKNLKKLFLMLGILFGIFACSSLPTEEDSSSVKSSVKFTMQNIANSANSNILFSATDEQTPSKVALTYKKSGEEAETSTTIELTAFGNSYITDDVLSLYEGNYELTKFDVLNDEGTTIYSTPVSGSDIAINLNITTALAYSFEVKEGEISTEKMQVVAVTDTTDPADFGHVAFTFDKVDFSKFYVEVLVLDDSLGWVYTTAQIDVSNAEGTTIKTASIDGKINKILVANSDSYKITISKDGYVSQELTFSEADLEAYESKAMVVKLKKAEEGEVDTTFHRAEWFLVGGEQGVQRRSDWWDSLEEQWKKAFNDRALGLGNITTKPSDENIQAIFNKTGIFVSLCGLTNLSGVKHLTNLTELYCNWNQLSSLTGLENCTNLTTLWCSSNQLSSLTGLENCTKLDTLYCFDSQLSSLKGIENCTNLSQLHCYGNQLSSLKGLENCTNLTNLYCDNNQLSSLTGIENCTNLTELYCYSNQLSSLTGLENCTNLTTLGCWYNQISSLTGLENCTNLTALSCIDNQLSSLTGLENCANLNWLNCSKNQLSSLTGLENCANLTSLDCSNNELSSLTGLENCANLTSLDCSNNELSSLTGIENCTNLTELYCYSNQLSSLTGIENCTNLTTLGCWYNQLSSLTGIENLTNLAVLACYNNQLSSLTGLENCTNLTTLWCSSNQLSSLTGLENCTNLYSLYCYNNNISEAEITRIKPYLDSHCSIDNRNR